MSRLRSQRDFAGGLFLVLIGALALWLSSGLAVGTAARMGSGYLPRLFAYGTIACGAIIAIRAFFVAHEDRIESFAVSSLVIVLLPIVIFGYTVRPFGMIAAGFVLCFLSALAAHDRRMGEAAIFAVILPVVAAALFITGLGLPLPAFPNIAEIRALFGG